jgi:1-acyl-sn-glycerol-3-phosphate acyltransferase
MKGFCSLARRTSARLIPVGIEGTFAAMPPNAKAPRLGRIHVVFGPPVEPAEYANLNDDQLTELLGERITICFAEARAWHRK